MGKEGITLFTKVKLPWYFLVTQGPVVQKNKMLSAENSFQYTRLTKHHLNEKRKSGFVGRENLKVNKFLWIVQFQEIVYNHSIPKFHCNLKNNVNNDFPKSGKIKSM